MSKTKKILMGFFFLLPAVMASTLLTLMLIKIDYGPDPSIEVGTTLWGTWSLCCGYYFKISRFYLAGAVLLGFALLGIIGNIT